MVNTLHMAKITRLKQYIESRGISQKALAESLGISEGHLSLMINGDRRPSPELAAKIESATGIPFRSLLLPEDETAAA